MLKCKATDTDDSTEDPRFGRVGKQTIEDTGPLTRKRMETVDEEFLAASLDFIDRQHQAGKPFFCWFNSTRMHIYTHLKPASRREVAVAASRLRATAHCCPLDHSLQRGETWGISNRR